MKKNKTNIYDIKDIAFECGVSGGAILAYIKYLIEKGEEIPAPIPYQRSYYTYDYDGANKIAEMFKNKKRGEMADYNYRHNYGKSFRNKYPRKIKAD